MSRIDALQLIEHVELTGPPERTASNLVPGLEQLPIHSRLSSA
jgi:hypothetical protein